MYKIPPYEMSMTQLCAPLICTVTQQNKPTAPYFIKFDSVAFSLNVQTALPSDVGSYSLLISCKTQYYDKSLSQIYTSINLEV